jgi:hypothetical protein
MIPPRTAPCASPAPGGSSVGMPGTGNRKPVTSPPIHAARNGPDYPAVKSIGHKHGKCHSAITWPRRAPRPSRRPARPALTMRRRSSSSERFARARRAQSSSDLGCSFASLRARARGNHGFRAVLVGQERSLGAHGSALGPRRASRLVRSAHVESPRFGDLRAIPRLRLAGPRSVEPAGGDGKEGVAGSSPAEGFAF